MKLLNIQKEIPDILLDIRYCTTYNFIGEIIDGYIDPVALGTKELVKQLKVILLIYNRVVDKPFIYGYI